MCAQNSTYSLFIPGFVLCTNPFLFRIKIANELSEFRNYLLQTYYTRREIMKKNRDHIPEKNHLPLYGVGPIYVYAIIAATTAGILCNQFKIIPYACVPIIKTI